MQNITHPFLNRHGSLNHALANRAARDARSDAIIGVCSELARALRRAGERFAALGPVKLHAA